MRRTPPIVSFVAPSGTGKTTLIEGVIRHLRTRSLRVAVVKHDAHRLVLDQPGKDSYRYRQAGAWRSVVASSDEMGLFSSLESAPSLGELARQYLDSADIVLTEGFRSSTVPAIRVHRAAVEDPTWKPGQVQILAWASDVQPNVDRPVLPLNRPELIADFLIDTLLKQPFTRSVTGLIAALQPVPMEQIQRPVESLKSAGLNQTIVVRPEGAPKCPDSRNLFDIRPGLGPLGALLTGLAAAETESVLFVNAKSSTHSSSFLRGLLEWGSPRADVVVPIVGNRKMPFPGLYGYRCLSTIQASLLSGEGRLDGWWSQMHVHGVPEHVWRSTCDSP